MAQLILLHLQPIRHLVQITGTKIISIQKKLAKEEKFIYFLKKQISAHRVLPILQLLQAIHQLRRMQTTRQAVHNIGKLILF